jgi:hypothetical protein
MACVPGSCLLTLLLSDCAFESFLSINPLLLSISGGIQLAELRKELAKQVQETINQFGPLVFKDFESNRTIKRQDL